MKKRILSFLLLLSLAFTAFGQNKEARLFDKLRNFPCDELQARLQNIAIETTLNQGSIAVIFVYEGKYGKYDNTTEKYVLPRFGESVTQTSVMQTLINRLKLDPKIFVFADGGFRENYLAEVWIVPKGARFPNPTPTLKTTKYRKGTPTDYCTEF